MMSRSADAASRRTRTYRRLAALAVAAIGVTVLQPTPAAANTSGSVVLPPNCSTFNGLYTCGRTAQAWSTNSSDPNTLGSRGATQQIRVWYHPGCCSSYRTNMSTSSLVYDNRSGVTVNRLRMSETYKALGAGGGTISVGWGVLSYSPGDTTTVTSNQVYFAMTRTGIKSMSAQRSLAFPHNAGAAKVEQVSNSTIEYPASNTSHRLVSQVPLTDY